MHIAQLLYMNPNKKTVILKKKKKNLSTPGHNFKID